MLWYKGTKKGKEQYWIVRGMLGVPLQDFMDKWLPMEYHRAFYLHMCYWMKQYLNPKEWKHPESYLLDEVWAITNVTTEYLEQRILDDLESYSYMWDDVDGIRLVKYPAYRPYRFAEFHKDDPRQMNICF